MCNCNDLTRYDFLSTDMRKYLGTYGPHFNRKLCAVAVELMRDSKDKAVELVDKEDLSDLLAKNGVELERGVLWDAVYVYCMGKADFYGRSIEDEAHLARFVKDYLDDPDGYDGMAFNRWWADCCKRGIVVDWEDFL